jgi:hypothetical protein
MHIYYLNLQRSNKLRESSFIVMAKVNVIPPSKDIHGNHRSKNLFGK